MSVRFVLKIMKLLKDPQQSFVLMRVSHLIEEEVGLTKYYENVKNAGKSSE